MLPKRISQYLIIVWFMAVAMMVVVIGLQLIGRLDLLDGFPRWVGWVVWACSIPLGFAIAFDGSLRKKRDSHSRSEKTAGT